MPKKRPDLKGLINERTTAVEHFQNTVIRPVIKMQHDLLIALLHQNFIKRKVDFSNLSLEKKKAIIKSTLEKDLAFKNQIIGVIIGHFSLDEFVIFSEHTSEYTRRIKQIILKRFKDTVLSN